MHRLLLQILSDGAFHSGVELGAALGISRAGVWKQVQALSARQISVDAVRGKGYRIAGGLDLLDAGMVRGALVGAAARLAPRVDIMETVDSTNTVVLKAFARGAGDGMICLAEQQTAGRGRRGRNWVSPYAANLYLSIGREFSGGFASIEGLSLAMGVAVCEAVESLGVAQVGLKWPNDIVSCERKLGGLLIEVAGDMGGACQAVIGVGLNVAMPREAAGSIDQPWADLAQAGFARGRRNTVAAALLNALLPALEEFANEGLPAFVARWRRLDVVSGEEVDVVSPGGTVSGVARGIDGSGALVVDVDGRQQLFRSGEVSLRRRP